MKNTVKWRQAFLDQTIEKRQQPHQKAFATHAQTFFIPVAIFHPRQEALVTSLRVGWLSEVASYSNMADYSGNAICDLSTLKRRDWTRHEHYYMLCMWRIYCKV